MGTRIIKGDFDEAIDSNPSKSFEDFFTKTTSTTPEYGARALVVTKTNGKDVKSITTVNSEGIRQSRITKKLNNDGKYGVVSKANET